MTSFTDDYLPLHNLQNWMQGILINPLGSDHKPPFMHLPPELQHGKIEDIIKPSKRLSARQRLAIYQRSYLARLRECMNQQFPALRYALGSDLFEHFADIYLQQFPSNSPTLMDLGERFTVFLEQNRPDAGHEIKEKWPDFMIELVHLEYAVIRCFSAHTDDENPPSASLDTPDERLGILPIFNLFKHQFPISPYYRDFLNNTAPELPFPRSSFCVMVRKNYKVGLFDLNTDQYDFLTAWKREGAFGQAKKTFLAQKQIKPEQFEKTWPIWKARWMELEILIDTGQV